MRFDGWSITGWLSLGLAALGLRIVSKLRRRKAA